MAISYQEAFMVLAGWKEKQAPLLMVRISNSGIGRVRVTVADVVPESGSILLRSGLKEQTIDVSKGSFDFTVDQADPEHKGTVLQARFADREQIIFVEIIE